MALLLRERHAGGVRSESSGRGKADTAGRRRAPAVSCENRNGLGAAGQPRHRLPEVTQDNRLSGQPRTGSIKNSRFDWDMQGTIAGRCENGRSRVVVRCRTRRIADGNAIAAEKACEQ